MRWVTIVTLSAVAGAPTASADEPDFLSAGETAAVAAISIGVLANGLHVKHFDSTRLDKWTTPPGFDLAVSRWLGGHPGAGKRNFLDDSFGSAVTGLATAGLMLATDLSYPHGDRARYALQHQLLFGSGLIATKGVTDICKGLFVRARPLTHLAPDLAAADSRHPWRFHHQSFISGHASNAFFAVTYLNQHSRAVMRREMSLDNYRSWRWLSPVVSYGWATFVALTRIQAYRHYLTDVAAGALVGYLLGELYYSLASEIDRHADAAAPGSPLMLQVTFRF
jgi:membrane-associated phospholipid phosphatase